MLLIAVLLPWLSFLLRGKIFHFIICLVLQLTLIGWLPAAIWAVISYREGQAERRHREMIRAVKAG
ncbi:MAG TPA: YqaE/Pmp3 family membrane protein [Cytophagales bacterium]|nr:YqaE/Pmp3 family membrane protein [Cytophagales bacterium]